MTNINLDEFYGATFTGNTGAQGTQGAQGTTGSQGIQGHQGIQGIQGRQGISGTVGGQGVQGIQGNGGTQGTGGAQGTTGAQGIQGIQGITGSQGIQGRQGIQGITGLGLQGTTGTQGTVGSQGVQGIQGQIGAGAEILITDDTSTNASFYPSFVSTTSGTVAGISISSSKLFFNPFTGTFNATEFNSLSDATVKKDFDSIQSADELLAKINTYQFRWRDTGNKSYGVIAQELEAIMPELVQEANDKKYVNYTPLIAVLIQAYKELLHKVKVLESKN